MLKTSFSRIKISASSIGEIVIRPYKNNVHIFVRSFEESSSFRLTQCYHEQNNDCAQNCQIYNGIVKISARKIMTPYSNATVNKRISFLSFWFKKNYKTPPFCFSFNCTFPLKTNPSCDIYCTMGRLFCAPKVTKVECSTVWCLDVTVPLQ